MTEELWNILVDRAVRYNDPVHFKEDPIAFPRRLRDEGASLRDIETAAVFAAHFAWGRRSMIVRDCTRLFDVMDWKPYEYVMHGVWKDDPVSVHRTIKWSDTAAICSRLREWYGSHGSLEELDAAGMRRVVFAQKDDPRAANKKIHMLRRWMVRRDGKVDLGLWTRSDPAELVIPLDVHVYNQASSLGLCSRKQKDIVTAMQITDAFREIFPGDPCQGDFALFGYGVEHA